MKIKYVEFALATIFLLTNTYGLVGMAESVWRGFHPLSEFYSQGFAEHGLKFSFMLNYFVPQVLVYLANYLSFIWVAVGFPNTYIEKRKWKGAFLTALAGFVVAWALMSFASYLTKPFDSYNAVDGMYQRLSQVCVLYIALFLYQAVKQTILFFWQKENKDNKKRNNAILYDIGTFIILWVVLCGLCLLLKFNMALVAFLAVIVPCCFIIYLLNLYWLVPRYFPNQQTKLWWSVLGVTFVITFFFNLAFLSLGGYFSIAGFLITYISICAGELCTALPLAFLVYYRRTKAAAALTALQADLDTSTANLKFLQGQINPHFLFNALNSLYGMALMEGADKTSEGIQLLGDMMRFVLHENNQDTIELRSEATYLQNYINLQNLRLAELPDVKVDFDIQQTGVSGYRIAPMLLVSFIENAYKHGISFKEASWISVSLSVKNNQLQFDVRNSAHRQQQNDPEKNNSGIGLQNVKERLALLYPERHSLTIRETETEFFIYLTIQL